jgi:glycosyltransferase involved in cell wall biosynthesis
MDCVISIIIPLYNKEESINNTINSVLEQTFKRFELIIVNDGSTDQSEKIVLSFNDSRIHLLNQTNKGVSSTRNKGVELSNAEWLMFLDADDILEQGCLNNIYNLISKYPKAKVYTGNYKICYKNGDERNLSYKRDGYIYNPYKLIYKNIWNLRLGSFIMKKDIFYEIGGFSQDVKIGEDIYFTDKILEKCTIAYSDFKTVAYMKKYSSLSNCIYPIENCYSWFVNLNTSNKYKKRQNIIIICKSIIHHLLCGKFSNVYKLLKKLYNETISSISVS